MEISLSGRSAIVTGGSKGIGLAVATRFAQSGADVAIVARGKETLDEAVAAIKKNAKARVIGVQADVGVAADIQRAYDEVMKAFGKVDIVVNNAGTSRAMPFEKVTDEILHRRHRAEAVRRRSPHPPGLAADEGAALGPHHQRAQHRRQGAAAEQHADLGVARRRHGDDQGAVGGVRAVQRAGECDAGRAYRGRSACAGGEEERTSRSTEYYKTREKEIPLGRAGKAEEFANLACFLVSEQGGYITGTATNVDGGRSPVV